MQFRILGPMEVDDGPRRVVLPAGRARALLALLVLHAGEVVRTDRLIDELWGENPPITAATVVQGLVSRLRRELEPGRGKGEQPVVLLTVGNGYRLAVEPDAVDANRFTHLLDESHGAAPVARTACLREALDLWRGPALADFTYDPFAQRPITTLAELRLSAMEEWIDAELRLGRAADVVPKLEELVDAHPFRERVHGLLMLALYRVGRQADALDAYRKARESLIGELAIEPGPELRRLEAAILRQDPALDAGPTPTAAAEETSGGWLPAERRTVTVVAVDVTTPTGHDADPEAAARDGAHATAQAREVFTHYGARVEHVLGELLLAFFGFPAAHEDDALRAVRATLEMQSSLGPCRAGIETGPIVIGAAGGALTDLVAGQVVGTAYRLHLAAGPGELLVGAATQRLVRGAILVRAADAGADDQALGTRAWRVIGSAPPTGSLPRTRVTPMFGRDVELSRLRAAFRRCTSSGSAVACTVVGEPGIGKSRLAREFVGSVADEARVLTGRCVAYGKGATFLPLREAVLDAPGADAIAGAIGLSDEPGNVHSWFPAIRRYFAELARERPLVLVFEDLHWAEPTFVDLVEYLARTTGAPLFVLALTRPELLERRHPRAGEETILLTPLQRADLADFVVARAEGQPPARLGEIVDTASGNPLFAEQLLAALDHDTVERVPASLQGLLTMRLDRLGPAERDVLRCASIIGDECTADALSVLVPEPALPFLGRHVDGLEHRQLVERSGGGFRFRHVLIERTAYDSMTRADRSRLHQRFATWLEAEATPRPPDLDAIAGYHLEQATQHRLASGINDRATDELAIRAGDRLADAAQRALDRFDAAAAENLLTRARELLPPGHARRPGLTQRLAEIDLVLGRFVPAQQLLEELMTSARHDDDAPAEWAARLEHARISFHIGRGPASLAPIRRLARQGAAYYTTAGDSDGRGRAAFLLGCAHEWAGQMTAAAQAFEESRAFADQNDVLRERLASRWMITQVLLAGPAPVASCLERCRALSRELSIEHPGVLLHAAVLSAMRGDVAQARRSVARARDIFADQFHAERMLMFAAQAMATIELLAGDEIAGERELRTWLAFARNTGEGEHISPAAARLSLVLRAHGDAREASSLAELAARSAPTAFAEGQALAGAAMARAAWESRHTARAAHLAARAVSLVPAEMLNLRADVLHACAAMLGAPADAVAEAADLYSRKGNLAAAERLHSGVAQLSPYPLTPEATTLRMK